MKVSKGSTRTSQSTEICMDFTITEGTYMEGKIKF